MAEHETPRRSDRGGAAVCLACVTIGGAALWYSAGFSALGSVFPRAVGGLLVVLGVVCAARSLAGREPRQAALEGSTARRVGVMAVLLAWAFALPIAGFLGSGAVAGVALLLLANHERLPLRRFALHALASGSVLLGLYLLFGLLLNVPLP